MIDEVCHKIDRDPLRKNLNKYTRNAFHALPELDRPRILDIGCGSGVPTVELARLSNGEIIGVDIDQCQLDRLTKKLDQEGLSNRVKIMKCSMFDLDFPDNSFDIIWAEGSISRIGFKRGLDEWRRFLKPNGFMVVHDEITSIGKKLEQVSGCGYRLIEHFALSEDIWWGAYYEPLEKRVQELTRQYADNHVALNVLRKEQQDVDMFKKNPKSYGSVFFVMQKER